LFLVQAIMLAIRAGFNSFRHNAAHTLEGQGIALHHGSQTPRA